MRYNLADMIVWCLSGNMLSLEILNCSEAK